MLLLLTMQEELFHVMALTLLRMLVNARQLHGITVIRDGMTGRTTIESPLQVIAFLTLSTREIVWSLHGASVHSVSTIGYAIALIQLTVLVLMIQSPYVLAWRVLGAMVHNVRITR